MKLGIQTEQLARQYSRQPRPLKPPSLTPQVFFIEVRPFLEPGPGLQGQRWTLKHEKREMHNMIYEHSVCGRRVGPSPALKGEFKAPNFAAVTPKISKGDLPPELVVRGRTVQSLHVIH